MRTGAMLSRDEVVGKHVGIRGNMPTRALPVKAWHPAPGNITCGDVASDEELPINHVQHRGDHDGKDQHIQ